MRTIEPFAHPQICNIKLVEQNQFIHPGTFGSLAGWGYTVRYIDAKANGCVNALYLNLN